MNLVSVNEHITIKNLDGANRSGTVIAASTSSIFGQFVTLRLDTPYLAPNALNISRTISLRIIPQGSDYIQTPFGKIVK